MTRASGSSTAPGWTRSASLSCVPTRSVGFSAADGSEDAQAHAVAEAVPFEVEPAAGPAHGEVGALDQLPAERTAHESAEILRADGVGGQADVPVALVLAVIPVTLILANLIAAGPGWTAARVRPARVLRAE